MVFSFGLTVVFSRHLMNPSTNTHLQHGVILLTELISGIAVFCYFLRKIKRNRFLLAAPRVSVGNLVAIWIGLFVVALNSMHLSFAQHTLGDILLSALLCIAIGTTEEFIFRGLVYIRALRKGRWYATCFSSLTFGLIHGLNFLAGQRALTTLAQVISATGMGFFLLGLMVYTRSIWTPVAIHALFDFAPVLSGTRLMHEQYTLSKLLLVTLGSVALTVAGLTLNYLSTRTARPQNMPVGKSHMATRA